MGDLIQLVEDGSLRATMNGCEVQLHLLWYRSLPLSCIERIRLLLDGQPVEPGKLWFGINGRQHSLDELSDLVEEYWFIQDSAILGVNQPGFMLPGETHRVEVELAMRYPYIPIGPGKFLTNIYKFAADMAAS